MDLRELKKVDSANKDQYQKLEDLFNFSQSEGGKRILERLESEIKSLLDIRNIRNKTEVELEARLLAVEILIGIFTEVTNVKDEIENLVKNIDIYQ